MIKCKYATYITITNSIKLSTLFFADGQVILGNLEDNSHRGQLPNLAYVWVANISTKIILQNDIARIRSKY